MNWKACELRYRCLSPLFLGERKLGFIQCTRLYIPGWTLWGAITANLTRRLYPYADAEAYRRVGEFVEQNLPTSYAWIMENEKKLFPEFLAGEKGRPGGWYYGSLPENRMEALFLGSYGQNSVDPATLTSETGQLFETEYINAFRKGSSASLEWGFTLYIRQTWNTADERLKALTLEEILKAIEQISVGGERKSGFGRLKMVNDLSEINPQDNNDDEWPAAQDWKIKKDEENPEKTFGTLFTHVPLNQITGEYVRGSAAPVTRRVWRNSPGEEGGSGPGQRVVTELYYLPGSRVYDDGWNPLVGPQGVWIRKEIKK